jgi:hypothetical protein
MNEDISTLPLVSPETRLEDKEKKAIYRPSAEIEGAKLSSFPSVSLEATLARVVIPVLRSWTKISPFPLLSFETKLLAQEENATYRPPDEIAGCWLELLALLTSTEGSAFLS